MKKIITLFICILFHASLAAQLGDKIDLSGVWRFQLDPMGFGKTAGSELYLDKLCETIVLPGSTDDAGKGIKNNASYVDRLSRKYEYCGQAWYQREVVIPESWENGEVVLKLERCHWETVVYVDGQPMASEEHLSTPNYFNVGKKMTPGVHTLTICVDNRLKYPMDQWDHGTTEYTQTNWNGIVGEISLTYRPGHYIENLKVFTDIDKNELTAKLSVHPSEKDMEGTLSLSVSEKNGREVAVGKFPVALQAKQSSVEQKLSMKNKVQLWDEFNPALYTLKATLVTSEGKDEVTEQFGFRKVEQGKHHVRVNGRDIHLRGVLDCAVFPKTGYPATDKEAWLKIFRTVQSYGMNHVRFHSWCPPEAAFYAADELGIYLQPELPMWIKDVGQYPARRDFFEKELFAILNEYGNHPSFILMCNGNENEGDFSVLEDLIKKGQAYDSRRLYSASTARTHTASDQFYVSHVTKKGWITVYEGKPSTDWDRNKESDIDVPVIAHETGQRCMYPNFAEISKYTGVLEPRNFNVFRERLTRNGMLHQAEDFFRATGAHTVLQYKEVNEALLRTTKSGGFQLLGLSDFPGQGSAFVGLLDAFWEDKGLVAPEKYRESCAPGVLLARFSDRVYTENDSFKPTLWVYNFTGKSMNKGSLNWKLVDEAGNLVKTGKLKHGKVEVSTVDSLGLVSVSLNTIKKAGKYTFHASMNGLHNEWDIWVYPSVKDAEVDGYVAATDWKQAKEALQAGEKVLFIPTEAKGRKTHFASHFWNPIMFNWDPMIVGTLIDNEHPAFNDFPTSYYADWQWWDVLNQCVAVDLTDMRNLTPVIQSVDTYEQNRKLGIAFEANVGKGKLFVACVDVQKNIGKRLATKQLLHSFKNYVASEQFAPKATVPAYLLDAIFESEGTTEKTNNSTAIEQLLNK